MVKANHNPSFWILKAVSPEDYLYVSLEVSSDGLRPAVAVWQIFLVCVPKVLYGFSQWSYSKRHEGWPYVGHCSDLFRTDIKLSNVTLCGFEKKKKHFSSQWFWVRRVREKLETLVRRVAAKYWRSWEQFSFLFSLQIENKTSKKKLTTRI